MTQNPNGFRSLLVTKGTECLDIMKRLNVDLFALSETNKNWDDTSKYLLSKLMQHDDPGATIAALDYSAKEGYLLGGTALLFRGKDSG